MLFWVGGKELGTHGASSLCLFALVRQKQGVSNNDG